MMSHLLHSPIYQLSFRIVSILSIFAVSSIIVYHCIIKCTSKKHENHLNTATKISKIKANLLQILLYSYLISALIINIIQFFQIFPANIYNKPSATCFTLTWIFSLSIGFSKTCIQFSYFLRLDVSYKDTAFQINKYLLGMIYILLFLYLLQWLVYMAFTDPDNATWNDKYHFCDFEPSSVLMDIVYPAILVMVELIISITALILFLKPLCHLKHHDNDDRYLHYVMVKVGLLNSIMIISTVFAILSIAVVQHPIGFSIDNVINSLCMVLMGHIHEKLYKRVCHCCLSFACCKHNQNTNHMVETVNQSDSNQGENYIEQQV